MSSTEMAPPPRHKPRPPSRSNSTASSRHLGTRQRYFVLESGILKYAKTQQDISKGKLRGSINVSLSVMSVNKKSKRVDLDAEDNLYHLKTFAISFWVSSLRAHRIIRKSDSTRLQNGVYTVLSTLKPLPSNGALLGLVSHHPPISVCQAESDNFIFWQDVRWKNKFWGKSLEIVPVGMVNVILTKFGDHYEWNKVTSCIHNILSGQRWIEHYGEVVIRNNSSSICQCKITFCKSKYWGSNMNEVQGAVLDEAGTVIHRLGGRWHEGIYCGTPPKTHCIWKPNPMPADFDRYYGFTRYALELNELNPELKLLLPPTDTRLRPDQRYLEEGNVEAAETEKQRVEQLQRDRRKVLEENGLPYQPRFFT
ncbi:UNVERIFIED_CONTAM: hypothetical protein FKN15_006288 [Acipenser sinensis]